MILQSDGGTYLTQSADVSIAERVFGQIVHLKDSSEAAAWRQVTEAEKDQLLNAGTIFDPSDLSGEYLGKVDTLLSGIAESINDAGLTVEECLEHKEYFPKWEDLTGKVLAAGYRLTCEGTLYEVVQEHTVQADWKPGVGTESLYKVVQVEHAGTVDDPIPWAWNMELFNGKYYTDKDVLYLCIRNSGMGLSFDLADLVSGGYVQVAEAAVHGEPVDGDTAAPDVENSGND